MAEIIYDGTVAFCKRAFPAKSRTAEQMVHAARSGKQNIAEGSADSATSKKLELKLTGVARASLVELLLDYQDYLRQSGLRQWSKDEERAVFIRKLSYRPHRCYLTYKPYIEDKSLETSANVLICVLNQSTYLLNRLLRRLEVDFLNEGGFTERLYRERSKRRKEAEAEDS